MCMNRTLRAITLLYIVFTGIVACGRHTWNGPVTDPGQFYVAIEHDSLARTYELHVPTGYDGNSSVPLVFDLHPFIINGRIMEMMTDFRSHSNTHGFILVQPNGIDGSWNGGPACCPPANENNVDDIGLIRAIRSDLIARGLNIDTSRVFADGMSNGGYLANKIACEDSDLLAAIAPVVASMGYDDLAECVPSKPMPVLMISGGDDNIVKREETFSRWVELNNCSISQSETLCRRRGRALLARNRVYDLWL